MSAARPAGVARALAILLVAALAALGLALSLLSGGGDKPKGSAFDAGPEGRLAAYLLLRELGLDARAWRDAPGRLPRAPALLWLPAAPADPPEYLREIWDEEDGAGEEPRARASGRQRDPRHYRRFLEEGGMLLTGLDGGRREFLLDVLGLDAPSAVEREGAAQELELVTRAGEALALVAARDAAAFLAAPRDAGEAVIASAADHALAAAVSLPIGRGRVLVVPDDGAFENGRIAQGDHALLLVRLIEELGHVERVLFDEYALGDWAPATPLELALSPRSFAFTLHVAGFLLLVLWSVAWAGAFPRDPEEHHAASPTARARAFGATMARLGRFDVLAGWLRSGVAARVFGARRAAEDAASDPERARALLAPFAHQARDEREVSRWADALAPRPVAGEEDLERLARDLAGVERLAAGERLAPRAARGHNHRPSAPGR